MTNTQVFFSLAGMMIALAGLMKWYVDAKVDPIKTYIDARISALEGKMDAKIDPIGRDVKTLIDYMISHEGRIARLEERTK